MGGIVEESGQSVKVSQRIYEKANLLFKKLIKYKVIFC